MRNRSTNTELPELLVGLLVAFGLLMVLAMYYQLWWKGDRVLYGGKTQTEQREIIFSRNGMNPALLPKVEQAVVEWPLNANYAKDGETMNRAYVEYMLAPRVPKGSDVYHVRYSGETCELAPLTQAGPGVTGATQPKVQALLLSLLWVVGVAALFTMTCPWVSGMEGVGLSVGLLLIVELVSRWISGTCEYGMALFIGLGVVGGGVFLSRVPAMFGQTTDPGNDFPMLLRRPYTAMLWSILLDTLWMSVLLSLILSVIVVPDEWDAWGIWGPKARVLAQGLGPLSDVTYFGHSDYPLLWPSLWAFSGWCGGGWEEQWSRGWGAVFLALTAYQLGRITLEQTGSRLAGLLTAAWFVSIPKVLQVSSWSYAEAPLWFFTALWFGRLLRARDARDAGLTNAAVAGVMAGLAALTKNEGVLIAVLGFLWLVIFSTSNRWRRGLAYAAPFLILYAPWALWVRVKLGLSSDATQGLICSADRLHYAMGRLIPALKCVADIWLDATQWGILLWLFVIAAIWLLWRGPSWIRAALLLPLAMWSGYFVLILFHTADILWQMGTSWDRLTIQGLVPLCVLVTSGLYHHLGFGEEPESASHA